MSSAAGAAVKPLQGGTLQIYTECDGFLTLSDTMTRLAQRGRGRMRVGRGPSHPVTTRIRRSFVGAFTRSWIESDAEK